MRGTPWYRQSLSIIWEDVRGWMLRHFHKWQQDRQIARHHTQQRQRSGTQSFSRCYFDDPGWESRPALDLISEYLNKLETVVTDAEAQFAGE